jgi:phosphoribosylformimino-5-aminoimidazole carboxamide ribonucleotide (ProFAR) isomerase
VTVTETVSFMKLITLEGCAVPGENETAAIGRMLAMPLGGGIRDEMATEELSALWR